MKILILVLAMIINLNQYLNPKPVHQELFQSVDRELVCYGGANAGKSYSIADKLIVQAIVNSQKQIRQKTLMIRKTLSSLRKTSLDILQKRVEKFGLDLDVNKSEWTAQLLYMTFVMTGMNNKEDFQKIKSLTDVDFIWVNEASEIRESDYMELLLRLRGQKTEGFRQIVCDFNPIGKTSWVYERFFEKNISNPRKLKFTVFDNPWAEEEYINQLRASKDWDENYYNIYFLGEWGELEGIIYPNWDIVEKPPENPDEVFYGGDFGYSVNPAALVRIYRKADEFWIEEVIYETELTNIELGNKMISLGIKSQDNYWDSAEPKSIQELCDMEINAKPAMKGADSVRAGIDFLKQLKIHVIEGSENIIRELKSYIWKKDKDGKALNEPIEFNNHAMSGIRYGIHTHIRGRIEPRLTYPSDTQEERQEETDEEKHERLINTEEAWE